MTKEKRIAKTIYIKESTVRRIEHDMILSNRHFSQEVNHNLEKLFQIRDENDQVALKLAGTHTPPQSELQ